MIRKFASLEHPNDYAYSYDTDGWTANAEVDTNFRMFQTYGDGLCQHSGDYPITREFLADYLFSLAAAMLKDDELAQNICYKIQREPNREAIEFCASVAFKPIDEEHPWEKKTRYYSVSERKISSTDSKRYDKRYQTVERWNDGTPNALYRMLIPEYASGLERILYAESIRKWVCSQEHGYMPLSAEFLEWTKDHDKARDIMHALEVAQNVAESYRLRCAAESSIESHKRNLERRKEREAEGQTTAA